MKLSDAVIPLCGSIGPERVEAIRKVLDGVDERVKALELELDVLVDGTLEERDARRTRTLANRVEAIKVALDAFSKNDEKGHKWHAERIDRMAGRVSAIEDSLSKLRECVIELVRTEMAKPRCSCPPDEDGAHRWGCEASEDGPPAPPKREDSIASMHGTLLGESCGKLSEDQKAVLAKRENAPSPKSPEAPDGSIPSWVPSARALCLAWCDVDQSSKVGLSETMEQDAERVRLLVSRCYVEWRAAHLHEEPGFDKGWDAARRRAPRVDVRRLLRDYWDWNDGSTSDPDPKYIEAMSRALAAQGIATTEDATRARGGAS